MSAYHEAMDLTEPISGTRFSCSILSDPPRVRDGPAYPADVIVSIDSAFHAYLRMTPADALALASALTLAADAANVAA